MKHFVLYFRGNILNEHENQREKTYIAFEFHTKYRMQRRTDNKNWHWKCRLEWLRDAFARRLLPPEAAVYIAPMATLIIAQVWKVSIEGKIDVILERGQQDHWQLR